MSSKSQVKSDHFGFNQAELDQFLEHMRKVEAGDSTVDDGLALRFASKLSEDTGLSKDRKVRAAIWNALEPLLYNQTLKPGVTADLVRAFFKGQTYADVVSLVGVQTLVAGLLSSDITVQLTTLGTVSSAHPPDIILEGDAPVLNSVLEPLGNLETPIEVISAIEKTIEKLALSPAIRVSLLKGPAKPVLDGIKNKDATLQARYLGILSNILVHIDNIQEVPAEAFELSVNLQDVFQVLSVVSFYERAFTVIKPELGEELAQMVKKQLNSIAGFYASYLSQPAKGEYLVASEAARVLGKLSRVAPKYFLAELDGAFNLFNTLDYKNAAGFVLVAKLDPRLTAEKRSDVVSSVPVKAENLELLSNFCTSPTSFKISQLTMDSIQALSADSRYKLLNVISSYNWGVDALIRWMTVMQSIIEGGPDVRDLEIIPLRRNVLANLMDHKDYLDVWAEPVAKAYDLEVHGPHASAPEVLMESA